MKKLWKLCLTLGVTVLLFGALTVSASAEDIEISTVDDFLDFAAKVNGDSAYKYSGDTVTLTEDLDFTDKLFVPVGNKENRYFSGTFDGGGHTISGITYGNSASRADYAGVFGNIRNATIQDLNVSNCRIFGNEYVGGIVGKADDSIIESCSFSSTDNFSIAVDGNASVGGIGGNLKRYDGHSDPKVRNCYNTGNINGSTYIGGIAGSSVTSGIENCYSTGTITSTSNRIFLGGIEGYGTTLASYCYYSASNKYKGVSPSSNVDVNNKTTPFGADQTVNGSDLPDTPTTLVDALNAWVTKYDTSCRPWKIVAGENGGLPVLEQYWTDAAMRDDSFLPDPSSIPPEIVICTPAQLGRLAYLMNKTVSPLNVSGKTIKLTEDIDLSGALWVPIKNFSNATFDGGEHSITNMDVRWGHIDGNILRAGLFSTASGSITNLSVNGDMQITDNSSVDNIYVGSLIGSVINTTNIENVYTEVTITVKSSNALYVGGLVGHMDSHLAKALNCSAVGDITVDADTPTVGGLVGFFRESFLLNCYYSGDMSRMGGSETITAGGLVGDFRNGTINNCYVEGDIDMFGTVGAVAGSADGSDISNVHYNVSGGVSGIYAFGSGGSEVTSVGAFALPATLLEALSLVAKETENVDAGYSDWAISSSVNGGNPIFTAQVPPPPAPSAPSAPKQNWVVVDDKKVDAGKVTVKDGVTTTQLNQDVLAKQITSASENITVIVPERTSSMSAGLVVKNLDELTEKQMSLTVQAGEVDYELPAAAVDTADVLQKLGITDPALAPLKITVTRPSVDELIEQRTKELEETAQKEFEENYRAVFEQKLVMPPLSFEMTASYEDKVTPIERFDTYVPRTVDVTEEAAARITTAVIFEQDGTTRHVPTEVFEVNGKWYAKINSRTNSDYLLISDDSSFADAAGTWYEAIVTEMAQRQVVTGHDTGLFAGDDAVTRAELAAMLVRALGLPANGDASMFIDVPDGAWFTGAVGTAAEYGLVIGDENGAFLPDEAVTRQDAMLMLRQAARVAGYPMDLLNARNVAEEYADLETVSDYASEAMYWNLFNNFFSGSEGCVHPQENLTRAEAATITLRLLQRAQLVDIRTP